MGFLDSAMRDLTVEGAASFDATSCDAGSPGPLGSEASVFGELWRSFFRPVTPKFVNFISGHPPSGVCPGTTKMLERSMGGYGSLWKLAEENTLTICSATRSVASAGIGPCWATHAASVSPGGRSET